jgi:glutamate dehydrogenase
MTLETRAEPSSGAVEAPPSLLDGVVLEAAARAGGPEARFPRFVRAFYAGVQADDLALIGPPDLYGGATSIFELTRVRRAGEPNLRVFNPDLARDGWSSPCTVIEIVNDDMPYLVDSVTQLLNRSGARVQLLIHPIVSVTRDPAGELRALAVPGAEGGATATRESVMQIRVRGQPSARIPVI